MSGIIYEQVNAALNDALLGGRFAGRPLYLVLDQEAREAVSARLGVDEGSVEDVACRVVGRTLWQHGNPYWRHSRDLRAWRNAGAKAPPPFTGLLFTLSHAAERMGSDDRFSGGNYYQRLAEVTGVPVGKLRAAGWQTQEFWQAFAHWLADADYAHGRPTARQIPGREHVSLAISQAIVRAVDRRDFHALFEKFGFTGADDVSAEEMARYLAAWIHGPAAGPRLKAAWGQPELRARVAEVALAELEAWATLGDVERGRGGVTGSATRLSLVASLGGFPRRRLALSIGRKADGEAPLALRRGDDGPELQLGNSLYGGFATLSPAEGVDIAGALRRGIEVAATDGSMRHEWRPRFVIPFSRSPSGPYWTEAARGIVGVEHMVLAIDVAGTRQEVDKLLAAVAIPGYTCATAADLPGVPPGWVLYEGVRLLRAFDDAGDKAADLSPVPEAGGLRIEGGTRLAQGVWHRWSPPVVRLDGAPAGARLELRDGIDEGGELVAVADAVNGWALLDLPALPLPASGDLFVRALAGKGHDHALSLLVRSARRARPLDRAGRGALAMASLDGAVELSATQGEDGAPRVRGLGATGARAPLPGLGASSGQRPIGAGDGADEAPGELPEAADGAALRPWVSWQDVEEARGLPCGERGFHWYEAETVPAGAPRATPVAVACMGCGHAFLREGRPASSLEAAAPTPSAKPPPPPPGPRAPPEGRVRMDLLLDALCFMGSGNWGAFEALVASGVDQPWEAAAIAMDLFALGHLDVRRRPGSGQVVSWSVAPPVLAATPAGDAFLAGFRSQPLVEALCARVETLGGRVSTESLPAQPPRVRVQGLAADALAAVVAGIRDPHGREILAAPDAAAALTAACLAMPASFSLLQPASLGRDTDLETYDLGANRWIPASSPLAPGAYRVRAGGTRYLARDADGRVVQAPHETAKLLAARQAGVTLHAHDAASGTFLSVRGSEPPGLLRRVLVACSGTLPLSAAGRVSYPGVPPEIAGSVLALLYPET